MMEKIAGRCGRPWLWARLIIFILVLDAGTLGAQNLNARDYFLLGAARFKCNACEHAVDKFSKAIEIDQKYAEAYYGRSLSYNCMGEYDLALSDIDRAIRLDGEQVLYREAKGRIRTASGDLNGGIREFQQALRLDSLCWQAWYGWGRNAHDLKDYTIARNGYDRAIKLAPEFPMARLWRGKLDLDIGSYRDALENLNRAAEMAPEYPPVFEWKGQTHLAMKDYEACIRDASEALKLDPNRSVSYYIRGMAKLALKHYSEADLDFAACLKLDNRNADANFQRGICHEGVGDLTGARKFFSKAIKRDRVHKQAYVKRADIWEKIEKPKKAVNDLGSALAVEKDDVELILRRGFLYLGLEENQSAINDFARAKLLSPETAAAFYGMGNAIYAEGNTLKACSEWRTAKQLGDARAEDQLVKFCVE